VGGAAVRRPPATGEQTAEKAMRSAGEARADAPLRRPGPGDVEAGSSGAGTR